MTLRDRLADWFRHEHGDSLTRYVASTELPDADVYEEAICACGHVARRRPVPRTPEMRVEGIA